MCHLLLWTTQCFTKYNQLLYWFKNICCFFLLLFQTHQSEDNFIQCQQAILLAPSPSGIARQLYIINIKMGCWCTSAPSLLFSLKQTHTYVHSTYTHPPPPLHPNPLSVNTDGSQCSSPTSFRRRDSMFSPWSMCICKRQFLLFFQYYCYSEKILTVTK